MSLYIYIYIILIYSKFLVCIHSIMCVLYLVFLDFISNFVNLFGCSVTLVYEDEAVCFAQLWNEPSSKDIAYMDVSQSIGRMPTSDAKAA